MITSINKLLIYFDIKFILKYKNEKTPIITNNKIDKSFFFFNCILFYIYSLL